MVSTNFHNPDYWYQSLELSESEELISENSSQNSSIDTYFNNDYCIDKSNKINNINSNQEIKTLFYKHLKISTLNEKLFKYLSLVVFCNNLDLNSNHINLSSSISMLIVNNLVDLFEFAPFEPIFTDLFDSVNRNSELSSLFLQCINTNWHKILARKELNLFESCLKTIEGIHLDSSCHLVSLLIEKFFKLPYLSLVRYADHIACQRVEMIHSLSKEDLNTIFTKKNLETLDMFYESQAENCARHQRLFNLLEQLKQKLDEPAQNVIKTSSSIEFFKLYLENGINNVSNNLDKEWFYNIVRSSCCYASSSDLINDLSRLKSKQCALILANLDQPNCESIFYDKSFKLNILKECLILSCFKTENSIEKLPSALKQAKNILTDFIHPLWTVSSQFLFSILSKITNKLPELTPIYLLDNENNSKQLYKKRMLASNPIDFGSYNEKFSQLVSEIDFNLFFLPLTESVNSYLKSIKQYPYLDNKLNEIDRNNVLKFSLFQIEYINFITSNHNQILSFKCLNESFLCIFNILSESEFIKILSNSQIYSTFVSYLIKDLYQLIIQYFMKIGDENLLKTPRLKNLIDYTSSNKKYTSQVLFNLTTLETLLKLRFIMNNQVFRQKIPFTMRDVIEKIYIALCRLPVLERFIRIPDCLWSQEFQLEYSQFLSTDTSVLPPIDNLKDPHVLKDHLRHILLIGWTTRNQFEYEYVNMLTFFHNISEDYYLPLSSKANSSKHEGEIGNNLNQIMPNLPAEEIKERNKCISLLIKGLSTWLIKSTLTPRSGNSLSSLFEHVSRNKSPGFLSSHIGQQYNKIKKSIDTFDRYNLYNNSNSISIANNSSLLFMLDPTMIDESNEEIREVVDFTQPQPAETLINLTKISNRLSERCNLTYSTNIERIMLNNLPTNSNSFFYFTQISLEGVLKFIGQWNKFEIGPLEQVKWMEESVQNCVSNKLNEVSNKTIAHSVQRSFNRNNLDIASVLRTILDYYESFFKIPSIQLKLDIFKSMLYLSNCLFDSKTQYESLSQKLQVNFEFLNLFITQESETLMPIVNDLVDDSTLSLAIYGECLAKCCLHTTRDGQPISSKDFERLNRLIENGLKSNSVLIKIATIHGLLYWLESISLGYLTTSNDAKILIDHLCKQIFMLKDSNVLFISNYRYLSSLWSASFYIIENCLDSIRDAPNFCSTFIKLTYEILNDPNTPFFLFYQLYLGLERLLLSCMVPSYEISTIQKLFTSKVYEEQKTLCLISLTVTSLYAYNQGKQLNYWHDIISKQLKSETVSAPDSPTQLENPILKDCQISFPQILELNSYPELQTHLLMVLEVATSFLDKMKISNTCKEASVYATILPKILCDFLPPHNILNKLITEFLNSSQHPYPQAVAYVVYKCFDLLQQKGMQLQIQEWCVLSLSNFFQRSRMYESIWLTSCLLVSCSQNQWLKSTFPFLLNRYCAFETIDKAIFYMSVIEFIKQLDDAQVKSILSTFEMHAKPGTPFEELLKLINKNSDSD